MKYKAAIMIAAVIALFISINVANAGTAILAGGQTIEVSHNIKYNFTFVAAVDNTTAAIKVDNEQDNIRIGQAKAVGGLIVLVESVTDSSSTNPTLDSASIQYGGIKLTGGKTIEVKIYNNPAYNVSLIAVDSDSAAINVNGVQQNFKKGDSKNMNGLQVYVTDIYDGSPTDPTKDYAVMEFGYSPVICTDSDGGKNYYVKGTISGYYDSKYANGSDTCVSSPNTDASAVAGSQYLLEYYCDSNKNNINITFYTCPNGCKDGACISSTNTTPFIRVVSPNGGETFIQGKNNVIKWSGGKNVIQIGLVHESVVNNVNPTGNPYSILGWISINSPDGEGSLTWDAQKVCDAQMSDCWQVAPGKYKIFALTQNENGNLIIWDGVNNRSGVWDVSDTPFSILSGGTCTDSDGGLNYYVKGTVDSSAFGSDPDRCYIYKNDGSAIVTSLCKDEPGCRLSETYCDFNEYKSAEYQCPSGCKDGACVQTIVACTDSDNGRNLYTEGNCNDATSGQGDYCDYSSGRAGKLMEAYCKENSCVKESVPCSSGEVCRAGKCVRGIPEDPICVDSDGGKNEFVKGIVYSYIHVGAEDRCMSKSRYQPDGVSLSSCSNEEALRQGVFCGVYEYSCKSADYDEWNFVECPNGCMDGACVQPLCTGLKMVWTDGQRVDNYDPSTDACGGYRCLTGNNISPACYNLAECNAACGGTCKSIADLKLECSSTIRLVKLGEKFDLKLNGLVQVDNFKGMKLEMTGIALPSCPPGSTNCGETNYNVLVNVDPCYGKEVCALYAEPAEPETLYFSKSKNIQTAFGATITMTGEQSYGATFVVEETGAGTAIRVTTPGTFSLMEGEAAIVTNYNSMKITLDKIEGTTEGDIAHISVYHPGGCGPNADPRCIDIPPFVSEYTLYIGGTADAQGLKIRFDGAVIQRGGKGYIASFYISTSSETEKIYVSLRTDKQKYTSNEPVRITAGVYRQRDLELTAVIYRPDGVKDTVKLHRSDRFAQQAVTGKTIAAPDGGATIEDDPSAVLYNGVYTGTNTFGNYRVELESSRPLDYRPAYFNVLDNKLLGKYLILSDIDEFKFFNADVSRQTFEGMQITVYNAGYKGPADAGAIVAEFGSRKDAQRALDIILRQREFSSAREEVINGHNVLVFEQGGNSIVLWTHRNFIVAIMYLDYGVGVRETPQSVGTVEKPLETVEAVKPVAVTGKATASGLTIAEPMPPERPVVCPSDVKQCPDGSYVGRVPPRCEFNLCPGEKKYIGTPEQCPVIKFMCIPGTEYFQDEHGCGCKGILHGSSGLPLPVIRAYLAKYKSDLGKPVQEKEVDTEDLLEVTFKLENLKKKFDRLQKNALELAKYYESQGDAESADRFNKVAEMFGKAKNKVDEIKAKIRTNIDRPESITEPVKEDIKELKSFLREILLIMLGAEKTEASRSGAQAGLSLFGG